MTQQIPDRFGPWIFDREHLVLRHHNRDRYEVDLKDMTTSAKTLDWIMQIQGKPWDDPEFSDRDTLAWFVEAIHALLDPQRNVCALGEEHGPIDPAVLIADRPHPARRTERAT